MNLILRILEFIVVFGLLIFLHELGHFLASRLFKIPVEEFGFGLPPRIVRLFTWKGTEFTINAIPFGAFVRPKGENDPEVPGGLGASSPWVRFAVFLGGPLLNILTGVLLFSILFTRTGVPDLHQVMIAATSPGSPAEAAGFLPGDVILSINGQPIDGMDAISNIVRANKGQEITVVYERDGLTYEIKATPRLDPPPDEGSLGIFMSNPVKDASILEAVGYGFSFTYSQVREIVLIPGRLIKGTIAPEEARFVGPVGIFNIYSQARDRDIQASTEQGSPAGLTTLLLMGTLAVALGFTNLLPLPALDGGHIIFLLPEIIFRKRVPVKYENLVHAIGLLALIVLLVFITIQDIINPVVLP
jgi:regulator of sigma E protease